MQIKTFNLGHTFGIGTISEFKALKNINLSFKQGEFIAIIGHTGSGKTTLIEHLNGLSKPTVGEVHIDNTIINSNKKQKLKNIKDIRKRVGIVFQFAEYQLFEETIEKDIIFGPINMGASKDRSKVLARQYIQLVGLSPDFLPRSPFALSGGQKRRVALAGILAMEPDILIFDEPTAGLDPEGAKQMYEIFQTLNAQGKTIIIVTHDLDHVLEYSHRTIMLANGQVVKDGLTSEVLFDINLLLKYYLHPPKLVTLINDLNQRCNLKVPHFQTIKQLTDWVNLQFKSRKSLNANIDQKKQQKSRSNKKTGKSIDE